MQKHAGLHRLESFGTIGLRKLTAPLWTEFPPLAAWRGSRYCVVKVFTGLVTPSLVPWASIESTL
jgi:hypothetical protein